MITKFEVGQRVKVLAQAEYGLPPSSRLQETLAGQTGTVTRLRKNGEAAWVRMDLDSSEELLIYRGECQLIPSVAKDMP